MKGLVLHCGANKVPYRELELVDTPAPTATHFPIAHTLLIETVKEQLSDVGMAILEEHHALTKEGSRYFGLMAIGDDNPSDDYGLVLGLRNSHDKSFNAGFCLGSQVFVCDNLAFSAEVKIGRKHTRFIERDLPRLCLEGLGAINHKRVEQDHRVACYKDHTVSDREAAWVTMRARQVGAISASQMGFVQDQWLEPEHEEFAPRNMWSLLNAFTEVDKRGKGANIFERPRRHDRIMGIMDPLAGVRVGAVA